MKSLGDLILKHPVPGMRLSLMRHLCAETLTELLAVTISPKNVRFDDGVLILTSPGIIKSALILRRTELLEKLKEKGVVCTDVR